MAKKFNIHKWQAQQQMKQWLAEQDDFTPDLEDDDLKRSKIQQMMGKEKKASFDPSKWLTYDDMFEDLIPWIESRMPGMGDPQIRGMDRVFKTAIL